MTETTSQNGWPALARTSVLLHTWTIPCNTGTIRLTLRNGSAGFLLAHFILWYGESVEKLAGKIQDDWGYAYRPIRGTTTGDITNHASGTAADLNATRHPLGTMTLSTWQKVRIRIRLRLYSGCIRAGLDYHVRKDEMHYEIVKPLGACERAARRLSSSARGRKLLAANPGQRTAIFS